jgi:hypothetical protein
MKKYRTKSGMVEEKLPGVNATVNPSEKTQIAMAGGANTLKDVQTILGQEGKRNNLKGQGAKHLVSFFEDVGGYEGMDDPAGTPGVGGFGSPSSVSTGGSEDLTLFGRQDKDIITSGAETGGRVTPAPGHGFDVGATFDEKGDVVDQATFFSNLSDAYAQSQALGSLNEEAVNPDPEIAALHRGVKSVLLGSKKSKTQVENRQLGLAELARQTPQERENIQSQAKEADYLYTRAQAYKAMQSSPRDKSAPSASDYSLETSTRSLQAALGKSNEAGRTFSDKSLTFDKQTGEFSYKEDPTGAIVGALGTVASFATAGLAAPLMIGGQAFGAGATGYQLSQMNFGTGLKVTDKYSGERLENIATRTEAEEAGRAARNPPTTPDYSGDGDAAPKKIKKPRTPSNNVTLAVDDGDFTRDQIRRAQRQITRFA